MFFNFKLIQGHYQNIFLKIIYLLLHTSSIKSLFNLFLDKALSMIIINNYDSL